jgi:hypothetical protein
MNAVDADLARGALTVRQVSPLNAAQNKSSPKDMTSIPATFLRVTASL